MSPTRAQPGQTRSTKRSPKKSCATPHRRQDRSPPARVSRAKNTSGELDGYIARAEPFARPILEHLRALFHRARPGIGEALKWGHPVFEHEGIVAWLAAFKRHVRFRFWKGRMLSDPKGLLRDANGNVGLLIVTDLSQLPSDKAAPGLHSPGGRSERRRSQDSARRGSRPRPRRSPFPTILSAALRKNKLAQKSFDAMSTSHRNEYVEWLVSAKQDATRKKRLLTAIEWLAEGKPRNWKYMKKAP